MGNDYFVHESSYIDDDVEIGEGTKSGTSVISKKEPGLERTVLWDRM